MTDTTLPNSVLFVCHLNSIRSPIAEGLMKKHYGRKVYVQSCGISTSELDELMVAIMREIGVDMTGHTARSLEGLGDMLFDLVIAFTPEAGEAAKAVFSDTDAAIEVWPLPDPTTGALDVRAIMNNYRSIRANIDARLIRRFGKPEAAA